MIDNRRPGCVSGHSASLFLGEITDEVSEATQNRDVVTTEIICGLSNGTNSSDLQ